MRPRGTSTWPIHRLLIFFEIEIHTNTVQCALLCSRWAIDFPHHRENMKNGQQHHHDVMNAVAGGWRAKTLWWRDCERMSSCVCMRKASSLAFWLPEHIQKQSFNWDIATINYDRNHGRVAGENEWQARGEMPWFEGQNWAKLFRLFCALSDKKCCWK